MDSEKIKNYSGLLCRLIIGGIFVLSGMTKMLASNDVMIWIFDGLGLPSFISMILTYTMPYMEIIFGLLFMSGLFIPYPALVLAAGLALAEIVLLQAWLRGTAVSAMPIFGSFMNHSLPWEIFQNVLIILLIYPAVMFGKNLTLDNIMEKTLPEKIR